MLGINLIDETRKKQGAGLLHQYSGPNQLLPSFMHPVADFGSEKQIRPNNAGKALGNAGMALGRNPHCLINRGESGRLITIQSVGIGQVGKNSGFGF